MVIKSVTTERNLPSATKQLFAAFVSCLCAPARIKTLIRPQNLGKMNTVSGIEVSQKNHIPLGVSFIGAEAANKIERKERQFPSLEPFIRKSVPILKENFFIN
ncbi:hypothetical protein Mgra_00008796 [Meloidogyne graminicola]|uniref:Uncharacterized protein n=1 Tax=Meloidogyne graminicola TaxID=189291 RepID=A0A8S9ZET9_9BILA|nr:hypothetical protein Mgra_00008796 [Meloidogyne graminicola]